MKLQHEKKGIMKNCVLFEAEDVNDPEWDKIIKIMHKNNITVTFGDGNYMCFEWEEGVKNEKTT